METAKSIPSFNAKSRPASVKSRTTNGKSRFPLGGDGRSAWIRFWKDLFEAHSADLGGDLSEARRASCEVVATLRTELKQLEAKMSEGRATPEEIDLYNRLSGNLRRYLEMLGLDRRQHDVNSRTLTIDEIGRHIEAAEVPG